MIGGACIFIGLQFVRPSIPSSPPSTEVQVPPAVGNILTKDCYSCHSNEKRLAWFDQVVPAYWLVRSDVLTAREHLNFSILGAKPAAAQKAALYEAANMIQLGAMPPPRFSRLHPEARVSPEDLTVLKNYLNPWRPDLPATTTMTANNPVNLATVPPESNGEHLDSEFENWQLISSTDRGDNNTFRFVLGNEIAMHAAQSGQISPWPDGSRLAKIAWQQEMGTDGLVHAGKFVQVELMTKDSHRYRLTKGWGWGRWRGVDLKPYGADAHFVNECTSCHLPMRGDDYVYTLPISAASSDKNELLNQRAAALPQSLPYQPLRWRPITMYVNPQSRTTAILFGNDKAQEAVRAAHDSGGEVTPHYSSGAVLALLTWQQREDPHWFGARIPDKPLSIEFVTTTSPGEKTTYSCFQGASLAQNHTNTDWNAERVRLILGLAPAPLP